MNDYYHFEIYPQLDSPLSETVDGNGDKTGWKLFRLKLSDFEKVLDDEISNLSWNDVRTMRLWVGGNGENMIKIAKIEIVGNEWEELGKTSINEILTPKKNRDPNK